MDFAFSDEQDEFRGVLRRFFEEKVPSTEVRRMMDAPGAYDPGLWKQMAEELGLQGVHLPEELGGQGFGFLELGIVLEEMGAVVLPSPFFASCVLAAGAIRLAGAAEQQAALLPGIASGSEIGTLALVEEAGSWLPEDVVLEARPEGAEVILDGVKVVVPSGDAASLLVVVARQPGTRGADGLTLCTLESGAPGVHVRTEEALDRTRSQARVELDAARARVLGTPGQAGAPLRTLLHHASVALASEMIGGAQRCLDLAVEYAKVRMQFARAIGSFQAVKHEAAEVLLELELARSAAYWALWVADEGAPGLAEAAPLAKAVCSDAYLKAVTTCIQIHGGIGFTWEHDAHLYYKRAHGSATMFGDGTAQRRALADELGI
jgi:alkylation response protein AidB-like acyl-CoA dehydrogenase